MFPGRKEALALWGLVRAQGYLAERGWIRSVREAKSLDAHGAPVPWMTYAFVAFVEPRLRREMKVFEYGSGASTHWWAERVGRVVSCEHDASWAMQARRTLPANVELIEAALDGDYAERVATHGDRFDIVVIDGRERVACAQNALRALAPNGVLLWDNSERPEYSPGLELLKERGFRRIDFWGLGPINSYGWCTSVCYRSENCLGI